MDLTRAKEGGANVSERANMNLVVGIAVDVVVVVGALSGVDERAWVSFRKERADR